MSEDDNKPMVERMLIGRSTEKDCVTLSQDERTDTRLRSEIEDIQFLLNNIHPRPYIDEFDTSYFAGLRQIEFRYYNRQERRRSVANLKRYLLVATMLILGVFFTAVLLSDPFARSSNDSQSLFHQLSERLPDNSVVTLAQHSSYSFFHHPFGRSIRIDGDLKIRIATDSLRPFYIHTGMTTIKTWGAEVYASVVKHDYVKLYVTSGVIEMQGRSGPQIISRGENIIIAKDGHKISKTQSDDEFDFRFTGTMTFQNKPLNTVIPQIEQGYNVVIRTDSFALLDRTFTGMLVRVKTVEEVLETICSQLDLEYYEEDSGMFVLEDEDQR